jgi:hypothetical protein
MMCLDDSVHKTHGCDSGPEVEATRIITLWRSRPVLSVPLGSRFQVACQCFSPHRAGRLPWLDHRHGGCGYAASYFTPTNPCLGCAIYRP